MKLTDCKQLSLKKVKISGNVIGKFGTFEAEQTFVNNTRKVLEVGYTFPIAETATVVGFEVHIGNKVMKGQCKETAKAKKEYTKNIVKGNSAYIMEEESDNIFSITIGKIAKGEEVKVKINYIDKFEIIDNKVHVFIPTLVPPKYNCKITDKLKYDKVDYSADFHINIAKNVNVANIESPTHKFRISENENGKLVEVLNYDMSRDFKLNFELANELTSNALSYKTRDGKNVLYMSFMPEISDSYEDSEKEYLFLVDVSGSMGGNKIEETKHAVIECLKQLDNGDKFNIIPFEHYFEAMSINSLEYNEENLEKAISYIESIEAGGGTEILDPIKFALYEDNSDKVILLFTDGEVGNEEEIITFVENNIGKSRLFPFGIDYNVNSYFLRDLAKVGNGKAELIMPQERIDDKIIRTFARIQTPMLENLKINYGNNKLIDEIREDNALFNYEFYNVFAKTENIDDDIILKGNIVNQEYSWVIKKDEIIQTDIDLEVLFAKMEMDRLEDYIRNCNDSEKSQTYKNMIIELSEKYNINSKYTSFLTVYEREDKILEAPTYQETTLSNGFLNGIKAKLSDVRYSISHIGDCYDDDCFCDIGAPILNDYIEDRGEMPAFRASNMLKADLAEPGDKKFKKMLSIQPKTDKDKLQEKVDEYFIKEFLKKENKSIVTYLLFALYYKEFNYELLINYLRQYRDEVLQDNEIQELLYCLCRNKYQYELGIFCGEDNDLRNKMLSIFNEFLTKDIQKAVETNLRYGVTRKGIEEKEIADILEKDSVPERINLILWYLYTDINWR